MANSSLYNDIRLRTGGSIYIGAVGPVRTGKSTFIKRFMDIAVLPRMENGYEKQRALDEMPQSGSGKTVMTTEPKFIPENPVRISLGSGSGLDVKFIDCVGYVIPEALGILENDVPRMVTTPWSDEPMSFEEAAELGTKKVITDHSTVGIVITADGSFTDIPRDSYAEAEIRVIDEMKKSKKPFAVILNSADPSSDSALSLAKELEAAYSVPVKPINCKTMTEKEIDNILESLLLEFPVTELRFSVPDWLSTLDISHPLRATILAGIHEKAETVSRLSDVSDAFNNVYDNEYGTGIHFSGADLSDGSAELDVSVPRSLFYNILSSETGLDIKSDRDLSHLLTELSASKSRYDKFALALEDVEKTGYGIVTPCLEDMTLEEPEIVKQAGSYGVKLKASAPSIHLIRADIKAEVSPIVGSEKQSEDIVKYLLKEFEEDPSKIWQSELFGTSLHELIGESLNAKLSHMPSEARLKMCDTLGKIINEGAGGLICILL